MNIDLQSALQDFLDRNPDLPEGDDNDVSAENADTRPAAVSADRLDIILEKKGRGGKKATIITGFTGSDSELAELASALKRKLATGGSARGGEILIQGDRRNDVLATLNSLGYKGRII